MGRDASTGKAHLFYILDPHPMRPIGEYLWIALVGIYFFFAVNIATPYYFISIFVNDVFCANLFFRIFLKYVK